jgi:hypothetical protein
MDEKRRWNGLECDTGIRDRGTIRKERVTRNGITGQSRREQLQLESTGNVNGTFRETLVLEIAHKIAGSSISIRKMSLRSLWRGRPPPKRKKKLCTE